MMTIFTLYTIFFSYFVFDFVNDHENVDSFSFSFSLIRNMSMIDDKKERNSRNIYTFFSFFSMLRHDYFFFFA